MKDMLMQLIIIVLYKYVGCIIRMLQLVFCYKSCALTLRCKSNHSEIICGLNYKVSLSYFGKRKRRFEYTLYKLLNIIFNYEQ